MNKSSRLSPTCSLQPEPPAVPAGPARFEWVRLDAQGGKLQAEWEDGYAQNAPDGVVAVADGAGDGIFSKLWAHDLFSIALLPDRFRSRIRGVRAVDSRSPPSVVSRQSGIPSNAGRFRRRSIDRAAPPPSSSCSTRSSPAPESPSARPAGQPGPWATPVCSTSVTGSFRLLPMTHRGFRHSSSALPIEGPQAHAGRVTTRGELRPDDTHRFRDRRPAERMLADVESGSPPDWGRFWNLDQELWRGEIAALREQNAIVNDDCTLRRFACRSGAGTFGRGCDRPRRARGR